MVYFTVAAIGLYALSDWILNQIEIKRGERLENRSVVFFFIIITLSLITFTVIQNVLYDPNTNQETKQETQQNTE